MSNDYVSEWYYILRSGWQFADTVTQEQRDRAAARCTVDHYTGKPFAQPWQAAVQNAEFVRRLHGTDHWTKQSDWWEA